MLCAPRLESRVTATARSQLRRGGPANITFRSIHHYSFSIPIAVAVVEIDAFEPDVLCVWVIEIA